MKKFLLAGLTLAMVMSLSNTSEACFRWGWRRSARASYRFGGGWGRGWHRGFRYARLNYRFGGGYGGFGYGGYGGGYRGFGGYGGYYGNYGPSFGGYYASASPVSYSTGCANGNCGSMVCANGSCNSGMCPNGQCIGPAVQSYAAIPAPNYGGVPVARTSFLSKMNFASRVSTPAATTPATPVSTASFYQKYAKPVAAAKPVVPTYQYSSNPSPEKTGSYLASAGY